jgi:hypothetical protein
LPTPDKWQHEVDEALFGTDEAEASPDLLEPAPLDFPLTPVAGSWRRDDDVGEDLFGEDDLGAVVAPVAEQVAWQPASSSGTQPPRAVAALDTALFGSEATSAHFAPAAPEPAAPPTIELPVLDEADAAPFADPDEATVVDPDEETMIAELADDADAAGPTGPGRGRRRVWVFAAFTALVVIIGATAGAVIAGRSGSTRPGRNTVSDHTTATTATTAPVGTTTPVVTTTPVPATAPAATPPPPPAPTAPRTPATSRRTVPPPAEPSVEPEPPPPAPPPSEPPPSTSPPATSPPPSGP